MASPSRPMQPPRLSAAWWLRWLLVLLLMFDQVGAPLHRHHHDSGIDDAIAVGELTHLSQPHDVHGEGAEHLSDVFHATTALRSEPRAQVAEAGVLQPADFSPPLPAGPPLLAFLHPPGDAVMRAPSWPPPPTVPRSLPPDGRAPPARA